MSNRTLTLWASALWRKAGHGDGDMAGEYVNVELDHWGEFDSKDLLRALIERHLIPLFPAPVELEFYCTHNPVRVVDYDAVTMPAWADEVEVELTAEQVMAVVKLLESGEIAYAA